MSGLVIDDPVTFSQVIASANIYPGDTILLRAGTYTKDNGLGAFDITFHGTAANPVTIRNYPGETVRINGGIQIQTGSYVTVRGLEIAPTPTNRDFTDRTGFDLDYCPPIRFFAPGCSAINCILHDGSEGIEMMGDSPGTIYGCIVYNNGWKFGDNEQTGYGIYSHNNPAARIDIKHNLFSKNFGTYGFHLNSAGNKIKNYYVTENGSMGSLVLASASVIDECYIDGNHFFRATPRAGQAGYESVNLAAEFTDNRIYCDDGFSSGIGSGQMQSLIVTGNKSVISAYQCEVVKLSSGEFATSAWNNNSYYALNATAQRFYLHGAGVEGSHTFAEWKSLTGYDADSTLTDGIPTGTEIFIYPNAYKDDDDTREGIVIIWNWESANSVNVDLSSLNLTIDTQYRLRQAQDPFTDTTTFTYSGAAVAVDMRAISHSVAIPTALEAAIQDTSFPIYGAFAVEKV